MAGHDDNTLRSFYLDYLAAINARDWPLVSSFACATVTHNGVSMTAAEYASMIDTTSGAYPGISFVPQTLLCDAARGEIACRIRFDFEKGERDSFYEHVFYRLEGGRIAQVWSMVGKPTEDEGER